MFTKNKNEMFFFYGSQQRATLTASKRHNWRASRQLRRPRLDSCKSDDYLTFSFFLFWCVTRSGNLMLSSFNLLLSLNTNPSCHGFKKIFFLKSLLNQVWNIIMFLLASTTKKPIVVMCFFLCCPHF